MIAIRRSTVLADVRRRALRKTSGVVVQTGAAAPDVEVLLADAKTVEDVDAVYRDMLNKGKVPDYIKSTYWIGRQIKGGGHTLDVLVAPDYGAVVGDDGKPFRIGKSSQRFAQEYADAFDSILPSQKLLRELEGSADVKLGFIPVQKGGGADDSVEAVIVANDKAVAALEKAGASDDDGLYKGGYRKSYVTRPNLDGTYIAIYGGRWSPAGGLVQPTSGKAHHEGYSDYSHALTLVSRKARLDGEDVDLREDVFGSEDPAIYGLVSDEGRFDPVFPNAGGGSKAEFAVGSDDDDEPEGGVETTVTSTTTPVLGGDGGGPTTIEQAGAGAAGGGLIEGFRRLSTPRKVVVVALVLLVGGGVAWAVL